MSVLLVAFAVSLLTTLWAVRSAKWLSHLTGDDDLSGPQKFHEVPVPRIGGVGIVLGVAAAVPLLWLRSPDHGMAAATLLACGMPAFLSGLQEDLTKTVSPRRRLFFTAVSAAMAAWLLGAVIRRTDIPGLDWLVLFGPVALALTVFVVAGVANSINIIDGFNGLASMCVVMMFGSLAYVGFQVGDSFLSLLALMGVGAVLGFFIFNFPAGLVFLGDGGAYFLGFLLAEVAILLVHRNQEVSPLFPLLLCIYPVFETLFSIYRRMVLRGAPPGMPDGVHLHSLIYRRFMRWAGGKRAVRSLTRRNSMTSPYLWMLCMLSVIPSMLWWNNTPVLGGFIIAFGLLYVTLYWRIVRFRSPRWLASRR